MRRSLRNVIERFVELVDRLAIARVRRTRKVRRSEKREETATRLLALDVYPVHCAPNGGQRGVFEAYYRDRETAASPLVAYQLDRKGENYYTGKDLAIFVSSGAPLRRLLDNRRRTGERTVYLVTERGRVDRLRSEVGIVRAFETPTSTDVSAEFCLVRAELCG